MDKKIGILVVSFGTSNNDTRKATIEAIEQTIQSAYPNLHVYQAWTSHVIIKKLMERDGLHIPTVCEALEQMEADGVTHVVVQPTHIVGGIENDRMKQDALAYETRFEAVRIGAPLLNSDSDLCQIVEEISQEYIEITGGRTALVFMGHGSTPEVNSVYTKLNDKFHELGHPQIYVGIMEEPGGIDQLLSEVQEGGYKKIILAPFLIVAGRHASKDMSGDGAESWKSRFEAAGYQVTCVFKGLGECEGVRNIFLRHVGTEMNRF